jgi:hypothetical protein
MGLVVLGQPASVWLLLEHARELDEPVTLLSDAGLIRVDSEVDWRLTAIER